MKRMLGGCALALATTLAGCDDVGDSTLRVSAWGEDFIEEGIPAEEFVDDWSVTFDAFVVSLGAVDADGVRLPGPHVIDLALASGGLGHEMGTLQVPAEGEPEVSWSLVPATTDAVSDVGADVLDAMASQGATLWVRGQAVRGDVVKTFDWSLAVPVTYLACETGTPLAEDEVTDTVLTVHADHLFYDDLDSEEPNVAFDLIAAADRDDDGAITMEELSAQSLDGQVRYQVGGRDIDDLGAFVLAQARTVGHINGEGHCEIE